MRDKGFTLIELIIAVAISAAIGGLLIGILVQNNRIYYQQSAKVSAGTSLNSVTSAVSNDIKAATKVVSGFPVDNPSTISSNKSLVLRLPALDSNSNAISNTYDYLVIGKDSINQNVLREVVYPDPSSSRESSNKVLTSNLSDINFVFLDNSGNSVDPIQASKVSFTISISSSTGGQPQLSSGTSTVSLRNE